MSWQPLLSLGLLCTESPECKEPIVLLKLIQLFCNPLARRARVHCLGKAIG